MESLGDTETALAVVTETLELNPGEPRVLLKQIQLLGTLGRFDEAEEPLRILRLAEGNALEVRRAAGVLYFRRGMFRACGRSTESSTRVAACWSFASSNGDVG